MARNYKLKKARPFLTFLVVLLVLCLLAMIFAFVWKLSNGFSDWSWFDTEDDVAEVEEYDSDFFSDDYEKPEDIVVSYGFTSVESVDSYSDNI